MSSLVSQFQSSLSSSSAAAASSSSNAKLTWEIANFSTSNVQKSRQFYFPADYQIRFVLECSPTVDIPDQTEKFVVFNLCLRSFFWFEPVLNLFNKSCVRYRIAILGPNGTKHFSQECENKFTIPYKTRCLQNKFGVIGGYQIKRDYLLDPKNGLLTDDKLTVYCEVDDNFLKKPLRIPENPIFDDFKSLLERGKFRDAVLLVDGKILPVHKNILAARSKVFAAMFEHDCEESRTNRVKITDVSMGVLVLMLHYIYTGKCYELYSHAAELFVAADKYQLNKLRNTCETYLMNNLTCKSAANILIIADMHQAANLKAKCITFITENIKQILLSDGWKVLVTKAELIGELFSKMADKQDILIKNQPRESKSVEVVEHKLSLLRENSLESDFESLLENGKFSDAFLVVENVELPIHRNILCARSKVFADLFAESQEQQTRVQVDNMTVEACKELLRYIYTGQVRLDTKELVPYFLEAAHKYQLNHLKARCEEFLKSSIDLDSVVNKLLLADTTESDYLKRNCFDFIWENVKQVIQSEGWATLKQVRPELAFQLFEHAAGKKW